jgi:lysylphosphatidylglycerol synthetase-like protein (DUF2156 family)
MDRDFIFALRQLWKNLKFSAIVVLTLALGIGATTAIFSVVSGVLLRPLPFPEPERIVALQTIEHSQPEADSNDASKQAASPGHAYHHLESRAGGFLMFRFLIFLIGGS